jgi:NhaP-type Na+/H+ or K+/H+ antiporter
LVSLLSWFLFGALAFGKGLQDVSGPLILYAILSLTIVLSIVAHGGTAVPFANKFGRRVADRNGVV